MLDASKSMFNLGITNMFNKNPKPWDILMEKFK